MDRRQRFGAVAGFPVVLVRRFLVQTQTEHLREPGLALHSLEQALIREGIEAGEDRVRVLPPELQDEIGVVGLRRVDLVDARLLDVVCVERVHEGLLHRGDEVRVEHDDAWVVNLKINRVSANRSAVPDEVRRGRERDRRRELRRHAETTDDGHTLLREVRGFGLLTGNGQPADDRKDTRRNHLLRTLVCLCRVVRGVTVPQLELVSVDPALRVDHVEVRAHRVPLDRRIEEMDRNPDAGIPWEAAKARVLARLQR